MGKQDIALPGPLWLMCGEETDFIEAGSRGRCGENLIANLLNLDITAKLKHGYIHEKQDIALPGPHERQGAGFHKGGV